MSLGQAHHCHILLHKHSKLMHPRSVFMVSDKVRGNIAGQPIMWRSGWSDSKLPTKVVEKRKEDSLPTRNAAIVYFNAISVSLRLNPFLVTVSVYLHKIATEK